MSEVKNAYSLSVWKLHSAIRDVALTDKKCFVLVSNDRLNDGDREELSKWISKLGGVIDYFFDVVSKRTPYAVKKRTVAVEYV